MKIYSDDTQFVVIIPKKEAECLGALFDACMDTVGCVEPHDIGVTKGQLVKAEDHMFTLSSKFLGES
jgi:hypothetical protein